MFVKILNTSTLPYLQSSKAVKRKDFIGLSSSPNAFSDNLAGISLVVQYLQGYRFWTNSHSKIADQAILRRVFNKAIELDEKLVDSGLLEEASGIYPSLKSTMQAFIDLKYVKNVDGVKFIKNDTASLKYYMYQYSGIILECNLTSTTYNAHDVDISSAGDLQNEYFTEPIYEARKIVRDYLASVGIETICRFGEWDYLWSDQSLLSGLNIKK